MGKAEYVGANRGDVQYIPPPSSAMSASPTTGYAQQAQYVNRDQIHAVDTNSAAPVYEKTNLHQIETINSDPGFTKEHEKRPNIIVRLWRHFWRHWIFYGLLGVIFLAIFLPVFFLVAFPAIAQLMVDKADLPIYNTQIMDPTPQSIVFSMNASLNVPKPFSVRMEPVTLSLFIDEGLPQAVPYVEVGLFYPDGKTLKGNATVSIENQKADIKDPAEFVRFLESAVYNEKFWLSAKGQTTAWLGKLKAKLKLNKKIQLNGLNMLKGFAINSARVILPPEADGTNFIGNITLPNASDVTFEMGNVTLNLKVAGLIVGHATILDVFLVPGNNSVEARGTANLRTIIANLPVILAAEAQAISKGNIELWASGNKTVYKGQSIYYFDEVLNKLDLSAQMPILKLLLDSAGGILGDVTGGGGLGALNITDTLTGLNVTDLIPMLLGPETGDNSNGGSGLLSLLGKRVMTGFAKRNTMPTELNVPVTMHKRSEAIARRAAEAEMAGKRGVNPRKVASQVNRFAKSARSDDLVAAFKADQDNIMAYIKDFLTNSEEGSVGDTLHKAILAGRSARTENEIARRAASADRAAKRAAKRSADSDLVAAFKADQADIMAAIKDFLTNSEEGSVGDTLHKAILASRSAKAEPETVSAVGTPIKRRQNVRQKSHEDVVAAIVAKERSVKRSSLLFDGLASIRHAARRAVGGIAGNAVAAAPEAYKRKRTTKSGREIVDSILSKREALDRFGAAVNGFGKRAVSNLKTRGLEIEASAIESLSEVARRHQDSKRGLVGKRAETPITILDKRFYPSELLGRFGNAIRGFAKSGTKIVAGEPAEARAAPPLHKRRNQKNHREVVAALLSRKEALDRFGLAVNSFGKRAITNLKTRDLNLDTSRLQAVKEIAKRREDAKRAVLDTRSDAPVVIKGRAFQKGELLGRFALTVRNFAKRGIDVVQGRGVAARAAPPLEKRRNQKNHREVVAALLSKRDALDRFGAAVNGFGKKAISNLKTRDISLDTSKLQAVKEIAKRREDAKRAVLDTRSEAPVLIEGRAFQKGELLGRFALTLRGFAQRGMATIQGRAVAAENLKTPRMASNGAQIEDIDDDDDLEVEDEDEKTALPIESLPNPLAAWANIGAVLQQRNTLALLGNVASLLAADRGLSKRDLKDGNGGAEAAAAVALGLTDVHKVMPLLATNSKALEAFGKLTANREIREVWAKLSESKEAKVIWDTFVKGREEAERAESSEGVV